MAKLAACHPRVVGSGTLRFLGHAGYLVEHGSICLAVDPWLEGSVFDDGWDLLVPAGHLDAERVTHLWLSHEHPDHFSVPAMRAIPTARRGEVTVIFQRTADRRVVSFLEKNDYTRVIEVGDGERVELGGGASLTTSLARDGDSCHLLDVAGFRIVNFNDCFYYSISEVEDATRALGITPGGVDLMATQFSYANWIGNPDELAPRQKLARRKLAHMEMQARVVKPTAIMPFASFVYFSHEENAYLNDAINFPSHVVARVRNIGCKPVLLRPDDMLELTPAGIDAAAVEADTRARVLDRAVQQVQRGEKVLRTTPSVPPEMVQEAASAGLARLRCGVSRLDFAIMRVRLPRAVFELTDYELLVVVDTLTRVRLLPLGAARPRPDVALSSAALCFAFSHDFGFDTLLVNGRFRELRPNGAMAVSTLCGQFGCARRRVSLVRSIIRRRLYEAPRLAIERLRNRALAP